MSLQFRRLHHCLIRIIALLAWKMQWHPSVDKTRNFESAALLIDPFCKPVLRGPDSGQENNSRKKEKKNGNARIHCTSCGGRGLLADLPASRRRLFRCRGDLHRRENAGEITLRVADAF